MPATNSVEMLSVKKWLNARPTVSAESIVAPVFWRCRPPVGRPATESIVRNSEWPCGITRNQPRLTILLPADCACATPASVIAAAATSIFL
ncbi:hypothetical protein D3C86_1131030 [compost metagenome]